jgi:hypothetical protein
VQGGAVPLDPDAEAFLLAASITDATITSASNNLVLSLKADSIWTKMIAIYPFVGGTALTHKFNLKNPADSDAAFRLTFVGSPTHDSDGIQGNGSSQYANTHLSPSLLNNDSNFSAYYSRTTGSQNGVEYGARRQSDQNSFFTLSSAVGGSGSLRNNTSASTSVPSNTITDGYIAQGRTSISNIFFQRKTTVTNYTLNRTFTGSSLPIYLMALNDDTSGVTFYSTRQFAFFCFGEDIDTTDSNNLKTIIDTFQTALSRNV